MGSPKTPENVSTDFGMNGGTSLHTRKGQASRSAKHNGRDGPPLSVIPVPNNKETSAPAEPDSLQLRILRFGFLQDGDVGVGVFPEGEEVLIGGFSFGGMAGDSLGRSEAEMSQRTERPGRSASRKAYSSWTMPSGSLAKGPVWCRYLRIHSSSAPIVKKSQQLLPPRCFPTVCLSCHCQPVWKRNSLARIYSSTS